MWTLRNLTTRPLRVPLHDGKVLHLGPRMEGQIATRDLERQGIRRLVDEGQIEIIDGGGQMPRGAGGSLASADSVGHHPDTTVRKRGDR